MQPMQKGGQPAAASWDNEALYVYDYLYLDTTEIEFAQWLQKYATESAEIALRDYGGLPLGEPVEDWIQGFREKVAQARTKQAATDRFQYSDRLGFRLVHRNEPQIPEGARLDLDIHAIRVGGMSLILSTRTAQAYEMFFFFYIRDEIRRAFDELPIGGESKTGQPPLVDDTQQRQIVRDWLEAKAAGKKKVDFAASIILPGQVTPGLPVQTLTRWQRKWESRLMSFLGDE